MHIIHRWNIIGLVYEITYCPPSSMYTHCITPMKVYKCSCGKIKYIEQNPYRTSYSSLLKDEETNLKREGYVSLKVFELEQIKMNKKELYNE